MSLLLSQFLSSHIEIAWVGQEKAVRDQLTSGQSTLALTLCMQCDMSCLNVSVSSTHGSLAVVKKESWETSYSSELLS